MTSQKDSEKSAPSYNNDRNIDRQTAPEADNVEKQQIRPADNTHALPNHMTRYPPRPAPQRQLNQATALPQVPQQNLQSGQVAGAQQLPLNNGYPQNNGQQQQNHAAQQQQNQAAQQQQQQVPVADNYYNQNNLQHRPSA